MGFNRTGDGIAGALLTLEALAGRDLAERDAMEKLPQRLVNVRVRERGALESAPEVNEAVSAAGEALEGRGRVLVRPSGTEPLVRVMVEAPTEEEADEVCATGWPRSSSSSWAEHGARLRSGGVRGPLVSSMRCAASLATSASAPSVSCCSTG